MTVVATAAMGTEMTELKGIMQGINFHGVMDVSHGSS